MVSPSRFCVATTFYGISFNITGFGLNLYLTQLVYALIEFPTKIIVYYLLDMIGRRSSLVGSLAFSGVCLGVNILIPKGKDVCKVSEADTSIALISPPGPVFRHVCCSNGRCCLWKSILFCIIYSSYALQFRALSYCSQVNKITPFYYLTCTKSLDHLNKMVVTVGDSALLWLTLCMISPVQTEWHGLQLLHGSCWCRCDSSHPPSG